MNELLTKDTGSQATTPGTSEPGAFIDRFTDDRRAGRVIGSHANGSVVRRGVDAEGVLAVDNAALRIRQLIKSGWGRSGIAYGPYARRNGLAFGAFLLNGHNISQAEPLPESLKQRLRRWVHGSEVERPFTRLQRWFLSGQKRQMWRRVRQWIRCGLGRWHIPELKENLAVGWFASEAPTHPIRQANALVMHALRLECGELWARVGSVGQPTVRGLQNVQTYYLVVLRERGAAYYAASIPGVPKLPSFPKLRPLAIDSSGDEPNVYAGVHQSVLGEIGFRAETRVYRTQVAALPEFESWYGSAQGADRFIGQGTLHGSTAEIGGEWVVIEGEFRRGDDGLSARDGVSTAVLQLGSPAGLLNVLVHPTGESFGPVALVWRFKDGQNYWCFEADAHQCRILLKENGQWHSFPASRAHHLVPKTVNALQVCDDGSCMSLYLNGDLVYATHFSDTRLQAGRGAGVRIAGPGGGRLQSFEAHPREIPVPEQLDLGLPQLIEGNRVVAQDDFIGSAQDIDGRATPIGGRLWRRDVGRGAIELTGAGSAKVRATAQSPCPGRTAYMVDWADPTLADVSVTITPPLKQNGVSEKSRGGLIFWQDDRNFISLSLFIDDWPGRSIAAFFCRDGFEELYDAVWTNVANRIQWGTPFNLRVVFDGRQFYAYLGDEPVLYRALTDIHADWTGFKINRVGIIANWEWGNDTGSHFQNFIAKDRV